MTQTHFRRFASSPDPSHVLSLRRWALVAALGLASWSGAARSSAQEASVEFDDHQNMMDQLDVKALRPGPDPNDQSTFDEATANPYADTMPQVLVMEDGTPVTSADQWPQRRAEIREDFEREIYGRIPDSVPGVTWEVTSEERGEVAGIPVITRKLIGRVDNSAYPQIEVNIEANFTVPADATGPVPMMISYDMGFMRFFQRMRAQRERERAATQPNAAPATQRTFPAPEWHAIAIRHGWGYGDIDPTSIQPDNNRFTTEGIIGLTNKGQPRTPEQWGALRAWAWGTSRLIDYFEQNPELMVDPTKVGIEGLSRYGKAAIVTQAFDPRVAVGLIGSSGQGGVKLHRHIFGEAVENLAGGGYYWMAGNYIKYGASDPEMNAGDLPVDSHQLIALCAPRPCFISYGVVEKGDAKWVDARGSFMAGVLASPVYELLGAEGFGIEESYLTAPMPPVGTLIGGELAWRQHEGGHEVTPNWPHFFEWVGQYIEAPPLPQPAQSAEDGE